MLVITRKISAISDPSLSATTSSVHVRERPISPKNIDFFDAFWLCSRSLKSAYTHPKSMGQGMGATVRRTYGEKSQSLICCEGC